MSHGLITIWVNVRTKSLGSAIVECCFLALLKSLFLRYHKGPVRTVGFHSNYPLLFSGSSDGYVGRSLYSLSVKTINKFV